LARPSEEERGQYFRHLCPGPRSRRPRNLAVPLGRRALRRSEGRFCGETRMSMEVQGSDGASSARRLDRVSALQLDCPTR
jgi:hypothetical protein